VTLECLLIADDLTGACDAAVQFALRGLRVKVSLDSSRVLEDTDVLSVSTESRDAGVAAFQQALARLPKLQPRILLNKLDSTLRGNVGQEVAAALAAFDCDLAVVTPAFPAMGRTVDAGYLRVAGTADFAPLELAACFRDYGVGPYCHSLTAAGGARFALLDATCDAHLDAIVAQGLALPQRVLWAGSAGLAAALARALGASATAPPVPPAGTPLFCLGSDHAVTLEQQDRLIHCRAATLLSAEEVAPEAVLGALRRGPVVLRIRRGHTSAGRVRELLADVANPLALSGGDTASLVCGALGVRAIELRQEVAPGIPCGSLVGGPFDQLPVVTKSGGFGGPDALMQVADFFTCSQSLH
jgi:uncharacterized protein YgbK (DUF1537 family)